MQAFSRITKIVYPATTTLGRWLRRLLLALGLVWSVGLYLYQPICLLPLLVVGAGLLLVRRTGKPRLLTGLSYETLLWGLFLLSVALFQILPGPQPKKWQTPWERAPQFAIEGNSLTIHNLRDFRYRSENDYEPLWRTESYRLDAITGVDFAECHWDGMEAICHTMMSFTFADGKRLVISAETRLPEGETQNSIAGLYKRYGLIYIFGTEEDIFRLRTNYRHEDLLLMPMKIRPERARDMLLHFVNLQQEAEQQHAAYNTAANNCSSGIMSTFRSLAPEMPRRYDLAPIHNGSISRILFTYGALMSQPNESYDELRKRCYLGYDISPDRRESYSQALRDIIQHGSPQQ